MWCSLLWLLLPVAPLAADMRGPHHPRGQMAAHSHYRPSRQAGSPAKITEDEKLLRDAEHIREDLAEVGAKADDTSKMTPEELEFHYFKLHDFDNNTKLDGLEILQAIHHSASHEEQAVDGSTAEDDLSYFVELIDRVLEEDDLDNDGYLSYPEYVMGRKKDESRRTSHYGHQ